jgi:hypothetical protein
MYVENKNITCGRKIWLPFHQSIAHTLFFLRFFITTNGPHVNQTNSHLRIDFAAYNKRDWSDDVRT